MQERAREGKGKKDEGRRGYGKEDGRVGKEREGKKDNIRYLTTDIFLMKSLEICILSHLSCEQWQRIPTIIYC